MELDNIDNLLDKYFEGETSLAEERILGAYFASANVAPEHEPYRPLFGFFTEARAEEPQREIVLRTKGSYMNVLSLAASVVILLGIGTFAYFNYEGGQKDLGTFDDPQMAYQETQKALQMLSRHVNTGVEGMQQLQTYEQSKNVIFKQ